MIKLIASDLDGTLLQNGAQSLNPGTADLVCELTKHGRIFVEGSEALISGLNTCYIQPKDPSYTYWIKDHVKNNVTVVTSGNEWPDTAFQ